MALAGAERAVMFGKVLHVSVIMLYVVTWLLADPNLPVDRSMKVPPANATEFGPIVVAAADIQLIFG